MISDQLAVCVYVLMTLTLYHIFLAMAKLNGKMEDVNKRWKMAQVTYVVTTCIVLLLLVPQLV